MPAPSSQQLFRQPAFSEDDRAAESRIVSRARKLWMDLAVPMASVLGAALGLALLALVARTVGVNSDSEAVERTLASLVGNARPIAIGLLAASAILILIFLMIKGARDADDLFGASDEGWGLRHRKD